MGFITECETYGFFFTVGMKENHKNEVKFWIFDNKSST